MVWGAIAARAAGALGGYIKNQGEQRRLDCIMEKAKKYKDGMPRAYGAQQDELIAALSKGGAEQSMSEATWHVLSLVADWPEQRAAVTLLARGEP